MGFLGVRFWGKGGGGKITPCLKPVTITLELQIWHASTHPNAVLENLPFSA